MAKTPSERQAESALPTPASAVESDILGEGECREIVVVPPKDNAFDDPQMHWRIAAALTSEFPQFAWRVTIDGPPLDNAFVLIPLLRDSDGLLRAPPAPIAAGCRLLSERLLHTAAGAELIPSKGKARRGAQRAFSSRRPGAAGIGLAES